MSIDHECVLLFSRRDVGKIIQKKKYVSDQHKEYSLFTAIVVNYDEDTGKHLLHSTEDERKPINLSTARREDVAVLRRATFDAISMKKSQRFLEMCDTHKYADLKLVNSSASVLREGDTVTHVREWFSIPSRHIEFLVDLHTPPSSKALLALPAAHPSVRGGGERDKTRYKVVDDDSLTLGGLIAQDDEVCAVCLCVCATNAEKTNRCTLFCTKATRCQVWRRSPQSTA